MIVSSDRLNRILILSVSACLAGAALVGYGRHDQRVNGPAHPVAAEPGEGPRGSATASAAGAPQTGGGGYVSDILPMGYWLSLDRGLKQPDGGAAPKGVTPNVTYALDEGTENLITDFGEQLARSAKGEPSHADCQRAAYSTDDVVDVPRLPPGSWFCARDRAGHLAKLRIDGVDERRAALRLAYLVWK